MNRLEQFLTKYPALALGLALPSFALAAYIIVVNVQVILEGGIRVGYFLPAVGLILLGMTLLHLARDGLKKPRAAKESENNEL